MRWKTLGVLGLSCLLGIGGFALGGETSGEGIRFWFGGSPPIGVLRPDVGEINAFLVDEGFEPLGEYVLLDGSGGRGRIGAVGGLSIGGLGWGAETSAITEDRRARLALGFGGLEVGCVIGGDGRSLLTLGVVLGGGGASLYLQEGGDVLEDDDGGCCSIGSRGLIAEPIVREAHRCFAGVMPLLSMQIQPLRFLGFELQLGYLFPVFGTQRGDEGVADAVSLELSGPAASLSFTWGWIGRPSRLLEDTIEQTVPLIGECVYIENQIGEITVTGASAVQTGSSSMVEIVAVRRARSGAALDDISVLVEETECGLRVRTEVPLRGRGLVHYTIAVPAGTRLNVEQGVGDISLVDFRGSAAIKLGVGEAEVRVFAGPELVVETGVGDVVLVDVDSELVSVDVGVGAVVLVDVDADQASVELGIGGVEVVLGPVATYTVRADVGIGEATVGPFPGVSELRTAGFAGELEAVIGDGEGTLVLDVGIGSVTVGGMGD